MCQQYALCELIVVGQHLASSDDENRNLYATRASLASGRRRIAREGVFRDAICALTLDTKEGRRNAHAHSNTLAKSARARALVQHHSRDIFV